MSPIPLAALRIRKIWRPETHAIRLELRRHNCIRINAYAWLT